MVSPYFEKVHSHTEKTAKTKLMCITWQVTADKPEENPVCCNSNGSLDKALQLGRKRSMDKYLPCIC